MGERIKSDQTSGDPQFEEKLTEALASAEAYEGLQRQLKSLEDKKNKGGQASNAEIGRIRGEMEDMEAAGKVTSLGEVFNEVCEGLPAVAMKGKGNKEDQMRVLPGGKAIVERREADYDFDRIIYEVMEASVALRGLETSETAYRKEIEELRRKLDAVREARVKLESGS